jgi:uncharacterized membrane protein YkvI
MKVRQIIDVAKIAATFVGTVVGAGFASGQELLQFFVSYGGIGFFGVLVTGVLFAWLGSQLLRLGYQLRATGYHEIIYHLCGYRVGKILDNLIAFFLFGGLVIMLAGVGTVFRDFLDMSYTTGIGFLAAAIFITVLFGVKGIASANLIVTPLLTVFTVMIGVNALTYHGIDLSLLNLEPQPSLQPAPHWLLACLLYVSYNLVLGATVLGPLGAQIQSPRVRWLGGMIGGGILTILAGFISLVITLHYPDVLQYEVPMLYVSGIQQTWSHYAYAFTVVKAMYSTALASLFGCATKLETAAGLTFNASIAMVMIASLICSQFGFANLIGALYPLFGYVSLYFIFQLFWRALRGM